MADKDNEKYVINSHTPATKMDTDKEKMADEDADPSFGIGRWRTTALSESHHLSIFAVLSGLMGMFAAMVRSSIIAQSPSFEKHYHFEPLSVGEALFMLESVGVFMVVFVTGFMANYMHVPRITGVLGTVYGIGMAVPAFMNFFDPYKWPEMAAPPPPPLPNSTVTTGQPAAPIGFPTYMTCNLSPNISLPQPPVYDGKNIYKMLYGSAMLNYGLLSAIRWGPMPFLFLDNNVIKKSRVGIYLAISILISEISRPLGYLFNEYVNKLPVDLGDTSMSPQDPSFVTAWWLGPIVFGCLTAVVSVPMLFLPAKLMSGTRQSEQVTHASVRAVHRDMKMCRQSDGDEMDPQVMTMWQKMKAYCQGVPRIIKNPLFLTLFVLWGIVVIPVAGLSLVNLQYTIYEFNITPSEAQKADALTNFIANGLAAIAGACVCARITRKRHYLEFIMGCVFFSFVLLPSSFFLGCDDVPIQGVESPKFGTNRTGHAIECPCDFAPTVPSCGSDGKNYLSPCHAGCTMESSEGYFFDCKNVEEGDTVIPQLCQDDCHGEFVGFSTVYTISTFIYKMADIPKILLAMRLIAPQDRGVAFSALGVSNLISSFLGPLALMKFFQDNCLVLLTDKICLYFDRQDMRLLKTGVEFNTYLFAFIMWFVLSKLNHRADKQLKAKASQDQDRRKNMQGITNENFSSQF